MNHTWNAFGRAFSIMENSGVFRLNKPINTAWAPVSMDTFQLEQIHVIRMVTKTTHAKLKTPSKLTKNT